MAKGSSRLTLKSLDFGKLGRQDSKKGGKRNDPTSKSDLLSHLSKQLSQVITRGDVNGP